MKAHRSLTIWLGVFIAGLLITACAGRAEPPVYPAMPPAATEAPAVEMYRSASAPEAAGGGMAAYQTSTQPTSNDRLVIKSGNLTVVVADPARSMEAISKMAEELGGFVVTANLSSSRLESGIEVPKASITIRVLAENFDEALRRIRAESDRLPLSETVNSQDVTSDYTDLQSRLRNLEAAEAQLTRIMESATKTEDVLAVYNQLVQVREQIEVIKGQMKYYEQSAALSSISVELLANQAVQPVVIGKWEPQGVAKQAIRLLIRSLQALVSAFVWVVLYVLPILLAFGVLFVLPLYLIVRGALAIRRRRRAQRTQAPLGTPPQES